MTILSMLSQDGPKDQHSQRMEQEAYLHVPVLKGRGEALGWCNAQRTDIMPHRPKLPTNLALSRILHYRDRLTWSLRIRYTMAVFRKTMLVISMQLIL